MEKGKTAAEKEAALALLALTTEIGERLVYRTTGRFLGAEGVVRPPLDSWGLVILTPTRLIFRRFAQSHPLFGGKEPEVRWDITRDSFEVCAAVVPSLWEKLFSGAIEHISLTGPGTRLTLESADDQRALPAAWNTISPLP